MKGLNIDTGYPGCSEVSLFRNLPKSPGHELEQPVQGGAGWADKAGQGELQNSLWALAILWFKGFPHAADICRQMFATLS